MTGSYKNYFNNQYKAGLTKESIDLYRKWFFAQWNLITRLIKFRSNKRVLEIGSGLGVLYSFLKEASVENYVGLELDRKACQFTNRFFNVNKFIPKKIEDYKPRKSFDFIFGFEILEHMENPKAVISKINKLLQKNGVFVGTSPYPFSKNVYADRTHNFVLHPENWRKLFLELGFRKVDTYPMSFIPYLWRINKKINIRIPFYLPFPYFISTSLLICKK